MPADSALAKSSPGFTDQEPLAGRFVTVETGWMVPVPGGTFLLGSPRDEPSRRADEGPQIKVDVAPMWVGKVEVTQHEYAEYQRLYTVFKDVERNDPNCASFDRDRVDVVTAPTEIYEPAVVYEYGSDPLYPAVAMTHYAAQQYTKWLSAITSRQYRLPTEAEWEYACRGNSTTRFSWGDDEASAIKYAWFFGNSDQSSFSRGELKQPNAFGLYDMLGNAAEWTVSTFTMNGYEWLKTSPDVSSISVVRWPVQSTSGVVRGGSRDSELADLGCASRWRADDEDWKGSDADFPKSPWWYTDYLSTTGGAIFSIVAAVAPGANVAILEWYSDRRKKRTSKIGFNPAEVLTES